MSGHAYHPGCGCASCCRVEDSDELATEAAEEQAAWDSLDPLQQLARNRGVQPFYTRSRVKALGKSYGFSLLDAKAKRIVAEIASRASERRMLDMAAACVAEVQRGVAATGRAA